jgi:hypothetical protein
MLTLGSMFCGNRVARSGKGTMLLRSKKACAFLFGNRTVTLTNKEGTAAPSSIVVEIEEMPRSDHAAMVDGVLDAGNYSVQLCEPKDLALEPSGPLDMVPCLRSLTPFIVKKRMSMTTPLLMHLGRAEAPEGMEGWMARKQASLLEGSPGPIELARRMLGLGYGLTPSGDDFILGIILAHELVGSSVQEVRGIVEAYENPLSRTILLDALDGQYALPVKRLGDAMLGNGKIGQAAYDLTKYGHSSGSDIISGIWYIFRNWRSNCGPFG